MSSRNRDALYGVAGLGLLTVIGYGFFLLLTGVFKPGFEVTAVFDRAGQLLRAGSDVKARGVLVGEVAAIETTREGTAQVTLRILPERAEKLPRDVRAAIRAKTLFGEKFVELEIPEDTGTTFSGPSLSPGDHIPLERTTRPMEVETVLEKAVPVLEAIDPIALAGALEALADGFASNVDALRRATDQGRAALDATRPTLPNFERNLGHLRTFSEALDESDEQLLAALDGLEKAGASIQRAREDLPDALSALTRLTTDLGEITQSRFDDLVVLAEQGTPILQYLQSQAPKLPRILELLDGFLGVWIADLSTGPNWRITFTGEPTGAQPYPPGQEPGPRTSSAQVRADALRRLSGAGRDSPPPALTDLLLAPVPTQDLLGLLDDGETP